MYDKDLEIILIVTGIIAEPSTREMYVEKTHENTLSDLVIYNPNSSDVKVPHDL